MLYHAIFTDGANNLFYVSIDSSNTNIFCELYGGVTDFVCVIQAIYSGVDTCFSCFHYECIHQNYVLNMSDIQDINSLPRNSVFCFVAVATGVRNSSELMIIQMGAFNTGSGIK